MNYFNLDSIIFQANETLILHDMATDRRVEMFGTETNEKHLVTYEEDIQFLLNSITNNLNESEVRWVMFYSLFHPSHFS